MRGETQAGTAEQLMRSRYTAFALGDAAHLVRTWDPATCPADVRADRPERWRRLEVVATEGGGLLDDVGIVEFRAHHDRGVLHERSRFARHAGRWVYVGTA